MTLRQQYANEEVVHKLRSMLNDLPTLRTRAIKKLEHWREAAIKRLLARQRELEKTLLDKFERLEFDTQLFVEKSERKKVQQQRRWQTEPIDYLNQTEIDRISSSLRSIREELEQSKLILAGSQENVGELLSDEFIRAKVSRHADSSSAKTAVQKNKETSSSDHDLGLELRRVLEICTSPQYPLSSLSTDQVNTHTHTRLRGEFYLAWSHVSTSTIKMLKRINVVLNYLEVCWSRFPIGCQGISVLIDSSTLAYYRFFSVFDELAVTRSLHDAPLSAVGPECLGLGAQVKYCVIPAELASLFERKREREKSRSDVVTQ